MRSSSAPGKLAKSLTAQQRRRDRLQQAPGLGLPAEVVSASIIDLHDRGVATSAIAEVFRMAPRAVRKVLERHRQMRASASKSVPTRS